jgi:hypothetical protein
MSTGWPFLIALNRSLRFLFLKFQNILETLLTDSPKSGCILFRSLSCVWNVGFAGSARFCESVLRAKSGGLSNAEKGGRQSENSRNLGCGLLPNVEGCMFKTRLSSRGAAIHCR